MPDTTDCGTVVGEWPSSEDTAALVWMAADLSEEGERTLQDTLDEAYRIGFVVRIENPQGRYQATLYRATAEGTAWCGRGTSETIVEAVREAIYSTFINLPGTKDFPTKK